MRSPLAQSVRIVVAHFLVCTFREELFYQLGLRQFGDFSRLKLEPPPPLRTMVEIALDVEDSTHSRLSKVQIVDVRLRRYLVSYKFLFLLLSSVSWKLS